MLAHYRLLKRPLDWALVIIGCIGAYFLADAAVRSDQPLLFLGVLLAPMLLFLAIRLPGVVFAAYLYIPFYKGAVDPYLPVDITALLAVSCLLLAIPMPDEIHQYRSASIRRALVLWTSALLLVVAGSLYAPSEPLAISRTVEFAVLVYLPCLLALRVGANAELQKQFLYSTLGLSALVIVLAFLAVGTLGTYDRVTVLGTNTIGTGRAAMLLPLIAPSLLGRLPVSVRPMVMLLIPFGVVAAVFTGSRGPLLMGVASIAVVYLVLSRHRIRNAVFGTGMVLGTFGLLRLPAIQDAIPEMSLWRIESLFSALVASETESLDTSSAARLDLWQFAAEIYAQNPIFGLGTAGFEAVVEYIPGWDIYTSPHNLLLQFASEFGSIGVVLLITMLVFAYMNALNSIRNPMAIAFLTLMTFGVTNSLVGVSIYDARWFWGFLLIVLALTGSDGQQGAISAHSEHNRSLGDDTAAYGSMNHHV